jgi:hypothetical protein
MYVEFHLNLLFQNISLDHAIINNAMIIAKLKILLSCVIFQTDFLKNRMEFKIVVILLSLN